MGFELSCDDGVGRLLATLAAAVPPEGRILEIGTGAGVGLAWLLSGLGDRRDVEVVSLEKDDALAESAMAAVANWPHGVSIGHGDALEILPHVGAFDLVFADAEGGKAEGLDLTLAAVAPGGILVVDDMLPKIGDTYHASLLPELKAVREILLCHPAFTSSEIDFSTGVIVSTRQQHHPLRPDDQAGANI
jgi:demethylmenaquinone methyltransferase/2-methoxy-6-polyprenyl-1,4-benzoquinol methylase